MDDFEDVVELAEYIEKFDLIFYIIYIYFSFLLHLYFRIANDENLFNSFHEWRSDPLTKETISHVF